MQPTVSCIRHAAAFLYGAATVISAVSTAVETDKGTK